MSYYFTKAADSDFQSIYRFIATSNPAAALKVVDKIEKTCETLSSTPAIGKHPRYILDRSVLVFPVKKHSDHLIFYTQIPAGLLIIRILHSMRDLPIAFYNK